MNYFSFAKRILKTSRVKRQFIFLSFVILGSLLTPLPSGYAEATTLPDMGSTTNLTLSIEEEKELGREFMRNVRQKLKLIEDPIVDEYIQSLGQRLVSQLDDAQFDYHFFIVDESNINAFAGPGGYIGIHTGLIFATKTEDELVSVMAHEIAHVSQRHLVRSVEQQSNLAIPAMAAIFAAILLGGADANIGEAVIAGTMAGSIQSQLNFSRSHEAEADNVGLELMAKSGYDPRYMAVFFETLLSTQRYAEANVPEFILTHPLTASRIAEAKNRAEHYPKLTSHPFNLNYHLIKARIRQLVMSHNDDANDSVANQLELEKPVASLPLEYYQSALDAIKEKKFDVARKQLAKLDSLDEPRIIYIVTRAELEIDAGKYDRAINILAAALLNYPGNRPLTELYADALIKGGKPEQARVVLEKHISSGFHNEKLYLALATACKQSGKLSEAYEAQANYHLLKGETSTAIEHLQRAMNTSKSDVKRHLVLATQLKKIKSMMRQKANAELKN